MIVRTVREELENEELILITALVGAVQAVLEIMKADPSLDTLTSPTPATVTV